MTPPGHNKPAGYQHEISCVTEIVRDDDEEKTSVQLL